MSGKSDGVALLSPAFVRVTLANFCFFLSFASFFLLPLHVRDLGGTERMVGFVMGTNGVAGLVSIFVLGPILDRYGRRRFMRGGLAVMLLSTLGYLFVDRVGPLLFALRIVQGVAFAAGFNAASTLAAELAPPTRRAAALGLFGVSTLGTHALAPTIGEQLVRIGGFDPCSWSRPATRRSGSSCRSACRRRGPSTARRSSRWRWGRGSARRSPSWGSAASRSAR